MNMQGAASPTRACSQLSSAAVPKTSPSTAQWMTTSVRRRL